MNQTISNGNLKEMLEMAVVSKYLQRVQPPESGQGDSAEWLQAHENLLVAISSKLTGTENLSVGFEIGEPMPGAALLKLFLVVHQPTETVTGMAFISQATNPPLEFMSHVVDGQWVTFLLQGAPSSTLVTATGVAPKGRSSSSVTAENFELTMVLAPDLKSGSARYKYLPAGGEWKEVSNAPVKLVQIPQPVPTSD